MKLVAWPLSRGSLAAWAPIGTEQTATGYEVAWKVTGADQYIVWNTDSSGNQVSQTAVMSGSNAALESLESKFPSGPERRWRDRCSAGTYHHDRSRLDRQAWSRLAIIFTLIVTALGLAPCLKPVAWPLSRASLVGWAPIGTEQTATGYEVAWKVTGADQYIVWNTDSSGNQVSQTAVMSGSNATLESLETSFHQDLNGDGVIGVPTSGLSLNRDCHRGEWLDQLGRELELISSSIASALDLARRFKLVAWPLSRASLGRWAPIGAEQTATGYEVAWKVTGVDQYIVWNTDSSGNQVSQTAIVSGSNPIIESAETSFLQDLNGNGLIGGKAIVNGTSGNDTLTSSSANEIFFGNGGSNTFVFSGLTGNDVIADFHPSSDAVQLSKNAFATFADVLSHAAQVGSDVTITIDAADSVTLHNTVVAQLTSNNFHLV